jgi:hypothetical protein
MKSEIIRPTSAIPLRLSEEKVLPQMAQISADEIRNHSTDISHSSAPLREKSAPADGADKRR